jgi:phosphomannomutase
VKCSQALPDAIKKAGGNPVMWKTGHSLIKSKMKEEAAVLASEKAVTLS